MSARDTILKHLADIDDRRRSLEADELRWLTAARAADVTWQEIADVCWYRGRQGAFMRWRALEGRYGGPGKPVCPKCGTSGCLEDKALDW